MGFKEALTKAFKEEPKAETDGQKTGGFGSGLRKALTENPQVPDSEQRGLIMGALTEVPASTPEKRGGILRQVASVITEQPDHSTGESGHNALLGVLTEVPDRTSYAGSGPSRVVRIISEIPDSDTASSGPSTLERLRKAVSEESNQSGQQAGTSLLGGLVAAVKEQPQAVTEDRTKTKHEKTATSAKPAGKGKKSEEKKGEQSSKGQKDKPKKQENKTPKSISAVASAPISEGTDDTFVIKGDAVYTAHRSQPIPPETSERKGSTFIKKSAGTIYRAGKSVARGTKNVAKGAVKLAARVAIKK